MPLLVEGKANMHTDFWESSWQRIDEKRLMEYAERKEQADPIPILETLKSRKAQTVCDAGCGCGAYVRRLAQQGFTVKGFDVSGRAVEIAEDILEKSGLTAELRAASVLKTGYPDNELMLLFAEMCWTTSQRKKQNRRSGNCAVSRNPAGSSC